MTRPLTRAAAIVLAVTMSLPFAGSAAAGGSARGGAAPVTAPDTVSMFAGNYATAKVLANDTDAEGDLVKLCGLGPEKYRLIRPEVVKRSVEISIRTRATPGTYTYTYYACDGTSQVPGTLTVVVPEPPRIKFRPIAPGTVRITSKADFRIRLNYGDFSLEDAATVILPKRGSVVVRTRFHRLDWVARTTDGHYISRGHLRHVPQRAG
jgi:hypothetical protein